MIWAGTSRENPAFIPCFTSASSNWSTCAVHQYSVYLQMLTQLFSNGSSGIRLV
jgi:hypothetical protein